MDYVVGPAENSRLVGRIEWVLDDAGAEAKRKGRAARRYAEFQSDRTSATCFGANQLRLLFSAFASVLFAVLRQALHGTRLARATAGTLRLKLLRIGARVMVSVRRVKVAMDSAHPCEAAFARVHARLPG